MTDHASGSEIRPEIRPDSESEIRGGTPASDSHERTNVRTYGDTYPHLGEIPIVPERTTRADAEPPSPERQALLDRLTAERFAPIPRHRIATVHRRWTE